jgi:cytochrome c biogenesis protein CcmG, thiol:disulfide interchange protein DsbE
MTQIPRDAFVSGAVVPENPLEAPSSGQKKHFPWGWLLTWLGLASLLLILFFGLMRTQQGPIKISKAVPSFALTTFDGHPYQLSDLHGKVVVLNFWASWCKPCEQEAADLETAWRYYKPSGKVVFLGVAWTDTEKNSLGYIQKFNITYPNGPDLGTRISQAYHTTGVPETYIIDQNGNLAYMKLSPFASVDEIRSAIDPLLEK